jgi:uncharacterized protein YdeI (YjbR/CyaY-like superfamily)
LAPYYLRKGRKFTGAFGENMNPKLCVSSRGEWRSWLRENHATAGEVWLVYYKKHTGKPTIKYTDSVEEALCFGWIDGLKKRIDEKQYAHRFTPRKAKSKWSPLNIRLAKKMIEEGKMAQAGLASFNQRINYDEGFLKASNAKEIPLTTEIEEALKVNKKAWEHFNNLAPGYKKQYVGWLVTAKRPETRKRRLEEAIKLLSENKKLGMK